MSALAAEELKQFFAAEPDASVADIKTHFQRLSRRAFRFVRARRAGHYGAFRIRSDNSVWLIDVLVDRTTLQSGWDRQGSDPRIDALLGEPDAEVLLAAAQVRLRLQRLDEIQQLIEKPYTREEHLQNALKGLPWLFGGSCVDEAVRRRLTPGVELDIPLLRADGVLHLVELKQANLSLVKRYRAAALSLTARVHDAVNQVANYLRALDERRDGILDAYGIDVRRASGVVVIGHPMFQPEFRESQINEALRVFTSHLSRVDVITYKELLDNARRSLELMSGPRPELLPGAARGRRSGAEVAIHTLLAGG